LFAPANDNSLENKIGSRLLGFLPTEKLAAAEALEKVNSKQADISTLDPHYGPLHNGKLGKISRGLGFK